MSLPLQMAITVFIGFALYIFVLSKVAVKPVVGLLDERGNTIRRAFDDIEAQKAELARLKAEYESRLAQMSQEADARELKAVADGQRIAAQVKAEAAARVEELLAKSKEDLEREIAKARIQFRDQVVAAATTAAEGIIREQLDAEAQVGLIDRYLEDLSRVN